MKNAPVVAYPDDEEELEYDSDGNPIAPEKSKVICMRVLRKVLYNEPLWFVWHLFFYLRGRK